MAALTFRLTAAEQALLRAYGVHQRDIDHTSIPELLDRVEALCVGLRQRGLDGHWTYSLPDHTAMLRIYKRMRVVEEQAQLDSQDA